MMNRNLSSRLVIVAAIALATLPLRAQIQTENPETGTLTTVAPATDTTTTPANVKVALPAVSYTVKHGESLGMIAHSCGMTLAQLKRLNNLPESDVKVKPGDVLQVVYVKGAPGTKTATTAKKKTHVASTTYPIAQPVQNFDMTQPTTGTAGSNSVTYSGDDSHTTTAPELKTAPVAKLVTPGELTFDERQQKAATSAQTQTGASTNSFSASSSSANKHKAQVVSTAPALTAIAPAPINAYAPAPVHPRSQFWNPFYTPPAADWGTKFISQARALGDMGINYDDDWRPPGESHTWAMDCSNTTRYLYKVTAGIDLPRTASDQYYYLHLQGKAWDVPQGPNGFADTNYLRQNLKPGDLLFWENTYRPERQPPITHVMIFLGENAQGYWIMAGSQSSHGGEHNRRNGGPDIYYFRPSQACGGYTTWMGLVHHQGRFCAFGRPLEADRSKLSVAEDN
jgi:cell wall-associated NlpC family hydrolase